MCGPGRGALAVELLLLLVLLVARGGGAARPLAAARTVAPLHDDTAIDKSVAALGVMASNSRGIAPHVQSAIATRMAAAAIHPLSAHRLL